MRLRGWAERPWAMCRARLVDISIRVARLWCTRANSRLQLAHAARNIVILVIEWQQTISTSEVESGQGGLKSAWLLANASPKRFQVLPTLEIGPRKYPAPQSRTERQAGPRLLRMGSHCGSCFVQRDEADPRGLGHAVLEFRLVYAQSVFAGHCCDPRCRERPNVCKGCIGSRPGSSERRTSDVEIISQRSS